MNDYGVVQWVDVLPTMAGAAAHSRPRASLPAGTPHAEVFAAAEEFASRRLRDVPHPGRLARRRRSASGSLARLADFLGLPLDS